MNFTKAFFLTNIHTAIKIFCGILMNKVISVLLGPSGLALLGQFQNFSSIILSVANGSIQTGIVKYSSEYKNNESDLRNLLKTSLLIMLSLSVLVSILVFLFSDFLSIKILFSSEYNYVFKLFASMIIFYSLNLYFLSFINGLGEIQLFTIIHIVVSLLKLIFVILFIYFYNLHGAFIGLISVELFVFITTYYLVFRKMNKSFLFFNDFFKNFNFNVVKKLLKYSFGTLSSGILFAGMLIYIRSILIDQISLDSAGLWEAAFKIIVYFNMLFVMPFSIYFLPKFSLTQNNQQIRSLLLAAVKFLLPLMVLVGFLIIFFKNTLVVLLFSNEFISIINLIPLLILAEFFKILALFFSNVFTSKSMVYTTVFMEFIFVLLFIGFSYFFISKYQIIGVVYSYLVSSIVFLLSYIYLFLSKFYYSKNEK